jgi:hypothetical protein
MARSDFHEIETKLRARISRLTQALNDVALSEPIPTAYKGWEFCRDVARDTLDELAAQDAHTPQVTEHPHE